MSRVLVAINCQSDFSYQNRELLQSLYGDRFDDLAFVVNDSCLTDKNVTNIVSHWRPAPLGPDNRCLCCPASVGDHTIGIHTFHPRLQYVAERANDYEFVLFVEDDCVLSPRLNAKRVQELCALTTPSCPAYGLAIRPMRPGFGIVTSKPIPKWEKSRIISTGLACGNIGRAFPARRFLFNPMCQCSPVIPISSFYALSLLREIIADFQALEQVWFEIAVPTAILHYTSRIGLTEGIALWGADRNRPLEELIAMLRPVDWLHPIKLLMYPSTRIRDVYRAISLTDAPR